MSGINFYISLNTNSIWVPNVDFVWGKATHFVLDTNWKLEDEEKEPYEDTSTPLNKEWSFSFSWLIFHVSIRASYWYPSDISSQAGRTD